MDLDKLTAQLIDHEGVVLHAYKDSLGYTTIGVGRMISPEKGGGITREEALYLLTNDIMRVTEQLDQKLPWWRGLDEVRQRVLADMAFNLSTDGLAKFRNTLADVQLGRWDLAAAGMLKSKWAAQVGLRAVRLAEMMRTGVDPA